MFTIVDLIGIVFNNWTALKLAVEHNGGLCSDVRMKIEKIADGVPHFLQSADSDGLGDYLDDSLDDEFNTLIEDDSAPEVADVLVSLHQHLNEGRTSEIETLVAQMPIKTSIFNYQEEVTAPKPKKMDVEPSPPTGPDEDGWTVVSRKK